MKKRLFILLILVISYVNAQELVLSSNILQKQPSQNFTMRLELRDVEMLGGRFAFSTGTDFQQVQLGVANRLNISFGPLGNLLFNSHAYVDTQGNYDIDIDAKGAGGAALAARVRLGLYNVNAGHFRITEGYQAQARPFYLFTDADRRGGYGAHIGVGLSYRASRTIVLELDPLITFGNTLEPTVDSIFHGIATGGVGFEAKGAVVFRRIVERDDFAIRASLESPFASDTFNIGLGAEYKLNRRNLPTMSASAWLVYREGGLHPAFQLQASQDIVGIDVRLHALLEPFRTTVPYRISLDASSDIGLGTVSAGVYVAPETSLLPVFGTEFSYSIVF